MKVWSRLVCLCLGCLLACTKSTARSDADKPGIASGLAAKPDTEITLSIVTTNDVHGRISQLPLFGGYLENLRAERAKTGGAVLLLDAGDIFQGTLESNATEGAAMVRAYEALGYDAVTLGNHEFDYGPVGPRPVPQEPSDDPLGALKARVEQATFPFLNANLRLENGKPLPVPKLRGSVLLRPAGVPIGIVGGVTEDVLRTTHAGNTGGIVVQPLAAAIAEEARKLRAQGARVVIALVHAGGECKDLKSPDDLQSCVNNAEAFRLARELPRGTVDIIAAGHTHNAVAHNVNGVAIVEAFSNGRAFGRVDVKLAKADAKPIAPANLTIYPPTSLCADTLAGACCAKEATYAEHKVERSQKVLAAIQDDLKRAEAARAEPVGVTVSSTVWIEYRRESPLNNLVADLMLRASPGADAAFTNAGGIRIPLPAGPLHYGTVFEMFPFDNTFATLKISAQQLADIIAKNLSVNNGMLALAGVHAAASCEGKRLRVQLSGPTGELIDPKRRLTVVTSDFLASAGDGLLVDMNIAEDAVTIQRDKPVREALLEGLRAYPGAKISGDDRRLFSQSQPRIKYSGKRPLRCD